jgi:hypothetical protein
MHSFMRLMVTIGLVIVLFALVILMIRLRFRPVVRRFNTKKYQDRWQEVQQLCRADATWPLAVINADKLVDEALKTCRMRGKTMGERLVCAQRRLSDNDSIWFGHKLRNKIVHEDMSKLKQHDVQAALRGFRQALKDLGALE